MVSDIVRVEAVDLSYLRFKIVDFIGGNGGVRLVANLDEVIAQGPEAFFSRGFISAVLSNEDPGTDFSPFPFIPDRLPVGVGDFLPKDFNSSSDNAFTSSSFKYSSSTNIFACSLAIRKK